MKEKNLIDQQKKELRKSVFRAREEKGEQHLLDLSESLISRLESTDYFQSAKTVLCYFALPFEVNTIPAINRWIQTKTVLLPVVEHKPVGHFHPPALLRVEPLLQPGCGQFLLPRLRPHLS